MEGSRAIILRRFAQDRLAVAGAVGLLVVVAASVVGGPLAGALLGHGGGDLFPYAVNANLRPVGPWTHVPLVHAETGSSLPAHAKTTLLPLGADGALGRDELIRLLDGGRASLEIGLGGVLIALLVGVPLGALAGYLGGPVDAVVSRLTELLMAFPLILFLIFASVRLRASLMPIAAGPVLAPGVFAVALIIGVFTCFYPLRLVRAQMLVLRDAEFVQAERMIGASLPRILRRHLLPHLGPTLLVWGAVAFGTNILLEVGISFLGVGVQPTTSTWGSMLTTTWGTIFSPRVYDASSFTVWQTLLPTLAIMAAVVSLNELADGLRRAFEPRSAR